MVGCDDCHSMGVVVGSGKMKIDAFCKPKIVASLLSGMIYFALIWILAMTTIYPTGWHFRAMYGTGILFTLCASSVSRLWIRNLIVLCFAGASGIFIGKAWITYRWSDVDLTFKGTIWIALTDLDELDAGLFLAMVIAWLVTNQIIKWKKSRKIRHGD